MWHYCATQVSAGGGGASVAACAGLTNQLLSCCVDPCLGKNTDTAIVGDQWMGVGGHHAMFNWYKKVPSAVPDKLRATYGLSEFRCH